MCILGSSKRWKLKFAVRSSQNWAGHRGNATCSHHYAFSVRWASHKADKGFLESKLANHCKLGIENWKHWPWLNSAYAGPNTSRIRLELAEISKKTQNYPFFATFLAYNSVWQHQKSSFPVKVKSGVPGRQSWRHKETIGISCTAQFVTHHDIWPKNGS